MRKIYLHKRFDSFSKLYIFFKSLSNLICFKVKPNREEVTLLENKVFGLLIRIPIFAAI